jgi:PIN domain
VERVFLDTNVLYPISIADLLLRLGDVALHAIVWSEDLLAEVERVLVEDKGLTSAQSAYFCRCIREEFADDEVRREDYEHLVDTMTGKDPDDHAHAAAARVAATVLLTFNVDDFPEQDMGGVRAMTPDDYLVDVLNHQSATVLGVIEDMGAQRREPQPVTATLAALEKAGLTTFAQRVRALRGPAGEHRRPTS